MKELFRRLGGTRLSILIAAILLFLAAFVVNKYVLISTSSPYFARVIQQEVMAKEKRFQRLAEDTALLLQLVNRSYDERTLRKLSSPETGLFFFIYDKDTGVEHELLFWNTQQALPPINIMNETDVSRMVRLSNGLYVHTSKAVVLSNGRHVSLEGLVPVMWKYFVEIENLQKEFVSHPKAGSRVDITLTPTDHPIKSAYGNTLFYLEKTTVQQHQSSTWSIVMVLLGLFFLVIYIHQSAQQIHLRFGLLVSTAFLASAIVFMRMVSYFYPNLVNLGQFELFDPAIYSSSFVFSSLGDLLINGVLFCWLMLFISRRLKPENVRPLYPKWLSVLCIVFALVVLVTVTFVFADIIQSLVSDAQISFNVTNFFSLTEYSFIGFLILGTISLSYFIFSQMLLNVVKRLNEESGYVVVIITLFVGLAIITFSRNTAVVELNLYVLLWLVIYILMMQQRIFSNINSRFNVSEVLYWLFVFSFSITGVIIFENKKIEFEQRKLFAEKLSLRADPSNERLLSIVLTYFDNDFLERNFHRFMNEQSNADMKDSIIKKNFSAYLDKYDTRIFTFDASEKPLYNSLPISFDTLNTIFRIQGKETSIANLKYFEKSFDKFSYIFKKEVIDSFGVNTGYFFVLSEPKRYKSDALIPELFRRTKELVPEYSPGYYYGIYSKLGLISYYNDYPFPTKLSPEQVPKFEFETRANKDFEELWYRHTGDKVVVIAKKDNSFIEGITLFSYLFSTFILLLFIYRVTAFLVRSRLKRSAFAEYFQFSIRSQIHSTIILVSLLSFLVIGVATILFFVKRYDRNNQDRLSRAIQIMVNEVQNKLADYEELSNGVLLFETGTTNQEIEELMQEISEIHGTDVNLYDTSGTLRVSSNPLIFNKGVLSEKMNPLAFYNLNMLRAVQFVADEQMGKVAYISVYCPVRDEDGEAYAYLNIPSYSTQGELKQEISNFLVTIINLNAFIFLVAGAIALFITNRITHSFTLIGQKMRDINLQKINQEIQWWRKDEIGELVKEYNKMVHKLDESAEALAKSEREGAWRQMARQVAHEIKNPLTPMKLSIQYLQKAIDNNSPKVKEMTANVARTLIEQIDHLSKIASDFSQFANIGNPRNEVFDLQELLRSLAALYEPMENVSFSWESVPGKIFLFADKTQLNRLFTNLMQNALEAPENQDNRLIEVKESLQDDKVLVSIRDNGGGIPVQTQDKIFMPNFTTKTSGTGLGLAMSKSIAEQARGNIWFEVEEGIGSTFFVMLPFLRVDQDLPPD